MKILNWKFISKVVGAVVSVFLFTILAIVIYVNRLEPLSWDVALRDFCYSFRGEQYGFWYWVFRIITEFGNFYIIAVITIFVIVVTKCDYRAILLALGILCAVLLNIGLKEIYMRERPIEALRWMDESSTSFPSGHSTAAGFFYSFLIYITYHSKANNKAKYAVYISCGAIIPLVMFSRMVLGVHYLSDVIAGVSIGIMVSCLMMQLFKICVKYDYMTEGLIDKVIKNSKKN